MADNTTTSFPKMGDDGIPNMVVNRSGAKSAKTTPVLKKGQSKGGAGEPATASHRANIQERLGAKLAPQAALYKQNAPEASATQRNLRIMPSRVRSSDSFYDSRREASR